MQHDERPGDAPAAEAPGARTLVGEAAWWIEPAPPTQYRQAAAGDRLVVARGRGSRREAIALALTWGFTTSVLAVLALVLDARGARGLALGTWICFGGWLAMSLLLWPALASRFLHSRHASLDSQRLEVRAGIDRAREIPRSRVVRFDVDLERASDGVPRAYWVVAVLDEGARARVVDADVEVHAEALRDVLERRLQRGS